MVTLPATGAPWLALSVAALAAATAVVPDPPGAARFGALWPRPRRRSRPPARAAAPVLLGALIGLVSLGPGGGLAGGLLVLGMRRRRARRLAAAGTRAAATQLADALRRMVDELRAGHHPAAVLGGLRSDGPLVSDLFAAAATAAELGDGVPGALRQAAAGRAELGADVERVAAAWSVADRHGVALAELLGRTQQDIRWRARFAATVQAQLAGPRATAAVLTALPALGLGLGQLVGADPVGVLRDGLLGQLLLVLGVGLGAAGLAWSDHILRSAVPR